MSDRLSADLHWFGQDARDECHNIGPAGRLTLVVYQPLRPGRAVAVRPVGLDWEVAERHRLIGIRNIFLECRVTRLRLIEAQLLTRCEIERRWSDRATAWAAHRPCR